MSDSLQLQHLHLRIADLDRSLGFYVNQLGFTLLHRQEREATLGTAAAGPALLALTEDRTAPPAGPDAAGLFHGAVLLPDRGALGRWLQFAAAAGVEFDGFADHGVSEAVYLSDPDGNGLEFYRDRPRPEWPVEDGRLAMFTRALAVRDVLAAGGPPRENPLAGADWGHLHLRVTDLAASRDYYAAHLGLTVTQDTFPGACFLAAGGYHHHLGLNVWGHPRQPQPAATLGLVSATFRIAGGGERELPAPEGYTLRLISAG